MFRSETYSPPAALYISVNARFVGVSLIHLAILSMNIDVVFADATAAANISQSSVKVHQYENGTD